MTVKTAYISLGGNSGNEHELFASALRAIGAWPDIHGIRVSEIYRSEPWGDRDQPWFHNQVAVFGCGATLSPQKLLSAMLRLETTLGRVRDPARRFGPRVIDLDLLLFNSIVCTGNALTLPHPRMVRRAFVLVPLLEIAPDLVMPDGIAAATYLSMLRYRVEGETIFQE